MSLRRLAALLIIPLLVVCTEDDPAGPQAFPYSAWSDSVAVHLNTSASGADVAGAVSNFPVLLRLSPASLPEFGAIADGGADLRFTTAGGEPMAYEVESWTNDSLGVVWVLVPAVAGDMADQVFFMYWGNPSAVSESNGAAVFDTAHGFQGVWHFEDYTDASARARTTEAHITSVEREGVVGRGQKFTENNNDYLSVPSLADVDSSFTLSGWARPMRMNVNTGSLVNLVSTIDSNDTSGYSLWVLQTQVAVVLDPPPSYTAVVGAAQVGSWLHVAATYAHGLLRLYADGEEIFAVSDVHFKPAGDSLTIVGGARESRNFTAMDMEGDLDEVREESVARSADWLKLCYANQMADTTGLDMLVRIGAAP